MFSTKSSRPQHFPNRNEKIGTKDKKTNNTKLNYINQHENLIKKAFHHKNEFLSKRGMDSVKSPVNNPTIPDIHMIEKFFETNSYRHYIAVYNTFPTAKNAELELLKRLEITCQSLNIGFFVIYNDNFIQNTELKGVHIDQMDTKKILFVLSLHPSSPKTSKHFTLMTIWNPRLFHDEYAWNRTLSVDGYLSAYSDILDQCIQSQTNKPFFGHLNTSLSGPILNITFGNYKCFYVGLNWEKINDYIVFNREKAINTVKLLNEAKLVSIYGPKDAWVGMSSYVGELEFDGKSIVYEIHKCGICLVLSSDAHIQDEICSNRLFEGLAAGVPIITDENPFMKKWFGDTLFYIDTCKLDQVIIQVQKHIEYFKSYPDETIAKIKKSREIFFQNFLMDKQLEKIVQNVVNYKSINFINS